jgi:trans-aconitate methyltransferase
MARLSREADSGMTIIEKATIMHYHRHRMEVCGHGTTKALGWKDDEHQRKRFEVLANVADLTGCSVLDVGCGYGDLKEFLDHRFSHVTYIGIDQQPECIAEARTRYGNRLDTFFFQRDFTTLTFPEVDVVMASGALSYRCGNPEFYPDMIGKMYSAASRAVAFNVLDVNVFPTHPLLVGHDADDVTAWCRAITPHVKVVRGYLEDDVTLFLYKEDPT